MTLERPDRRKTLVRGTAAVTATAALLSRSLPESWTRPVVESVLLPAHAQTSDEKTEAKSDPPRCSCEITSLDLYTDQYILEFSVSDCTDIDDLRLSWTGLTPPSATVFPSFDPTDTGTISNSSSFVGDEEYTAMLEVRDADDNVLSTCTLTAIVAASGG